MIYINYFIIYSVLGFLLESGVYKFLDISKHSGILYGPYTLIYGIGVIFSIIIFELLQLKKINKYLRIIIYFLLFTITLTFIEYLGGNILKYLFNIDMWNYLDHKYHFGKYICLDLAITWGFLGIINIYFLYPIIKKISKNIPSILTIISFILILLDLIITLFIKL